MEEAALPTAVHPAPARLRWRRWRDRASYALFLAATLVGIASLLVLLADILHDAWGWLDWDFLTSYPSRRPADAGIRAALLGTAWVAGLTALFTFLVGVGAALYLEEYARKGWLGRLIELNIANLAGVPSIVYGLLGLAVFVRALALGRTVLAGALTLSLLVLPIVIVAAREALRAVPPSLREGGYALGATRWQVIWHIVLPQALPGILTGTILALSRAIGETAPLIVIGALHFVPFDPAGPLSRFTVLPIQVFNWTTRPQTDFHHAAAAAIVVLLVVLLAMNAVAVYWRSRLQRRAEW